MTATSQAQRHQLQLKRGNCLEMAWLTSCYFFFAFLHLKGWSLILRGLSSTSTQRWCFGVFTSPNGASIFNRLDGIGILLHTLAFGLAVKKDMFKV